MTNETWLAATGVERFDRDIRTMTPEQLIEAFGSSRGILVTTRLIRALALQCYEAIRRGDEEPIQGNVRSFWYRYVKPVLARVPANQRRRERADLAVSKTLTSLIRYRGLMSYAGFGFTDENWRNRVIGVERPQVLVFTEKTAHLRLLLRLNKRFGVSVLTLGGFPSACTSEFTATQLNEALARSASGSDTPVHLIAIVDHDPAGALVARTFVEQLARFGCKPASMRTVVTPDLLDAEALEHHRIAQKNDARTATWLAETGGIDGKADGFSVSAVPVSTLEKAASAVILELAPEPLAAVLPEGVTGDVRWQRTVQEAGGDANVVVIHPRQLDAHVLNAVDNGKHVVVVQDGKVRAVLS